MRARRGRRSAAYPAAARFPSTGISKASYRIAICWRRRRMRRCTGKARAACFPRSTCRCPMTPAVAARGVERRLQRILRRARIWRHRQSRGSVLDAAEIMAKTFKVGDHVSWNSEAGRVSGHIVRVHTSEVNYKGYVHHASEDEPQYEIKSDKTDHIALHKGKALRLLRR